MLIFLGIILLLVIIGVVIYNRFIQLRALMQEAFSGIDVQLKRRHDLIPNIVETVKGYSGYEKSLLEKVTQLRSDFVQNKGDKEQKENELASALKTIFAVAENYPNLKADQHFLELQKTLTDIEDQLQMARRYYNGTVRNNNILVQSFPSDVIARLFGFKTASFFEIEYATERAVPDVRLGA